MLANDPFWQGVWLPGWFIKMLVLPACAGQCLLQLYSIPRGTGLGSVYTVRTPGPRRVRYGWRYGCLVHDGFVCLCVWLVLAFVHGEWSEG